MNADEIRAIRLTKEGNGTTTEHYENVKCLPDCEDRDEQGVSHTEDCPRFEAEKNYWATYFGVGTPAFQAMAPLMNKWCSFCQRTLKVSANQNECPVCNREELQ